ncbi:MBL fold metallo-hydrolase [Cohnella candidum]|uniref:MBL fold metallo-hydrolase n=1 Tax=Cohnella candidum TaxID=2674991 RepID=A0A3G3JYM7_9BACL|nr:MBL fold metallo-hydrolase [Cohnella candidum]AYQ72957.1 MBL fold metallo-hydrolase [Cohnella candidum]
MAANAGVKPLKLDIGTKGDPFVVHASVLWDENELVLVDTGLPGQLELIREAMERESLPFDKLTKIIITHQDRDHIGSLPELVQAFDGKIQVLAHEVGVPYLQGEIPLVKSGTFAKPVKVDVKLQDGVVLPIAGGVKVIFTPGHTPDHMCLYHEPSRTLITGDALTADNGVLMPPNPKVTPDWEGAIHSLSKLLDYDIATAITYHGGVCTDNIRERLTEISAS